MARKPYQTRLPAPFLKTLAARPDVLEENKAYPFNLPWLHAAPFEFEFTTPVTIFIGENGSGKSTLIEAIADLCGYDSAGGGKGYRPVDHSRALDQSGAALSKAFRASWLPRVTSGWFFRAESFYSVARYLDAASLDANQAPPDYLSWSHGEGFVRFFEDRFERQGLYFMDEPESALSPQRQLDLLRILNRIQETAQSQIIMATHSPILMALPGARLIEVTRGGLIDTTLLATKHFRLYQEFIVDPESFISEALAEG